MVCDKRLENTWGNILEKCLGKSGEKDELDNNTLRRYNTGKRIEVGCAWKISVI